jgi:hypothetical protein
MYWSIRHLTCFSTVRIPVISLSYLDSICGIAQDGLICHRIWPWRAFARIITAVLWTVLLAAAEPSRSPTRGGGASVPMDSWMYPALDRLAALGYVPSQIAGVRPWTRAEVRRQVDEASAVAERKGPEADRQGWTCWRRCGPSSCRMRWRDRPYPLTASISAPGRLGARR